MLVGSRQDAVNVHALISGDYGGVRLSPRLLNDGRYAVPSETLVDPEYIDAIPLLSRWSEESLSDEDYAFVPPREGSPLYIEVDSKLAWQSGRRSSLTMPTLDMFRFEVRANDFSGPADSRNGNRRSEIVFERNQGVGNGAIAWSAFCFILGDTPGLAETTHGIVHQWHSHDLDVSRSPVLSINAASDGLKIRTCSSAHLYGGSGSGTRHPENGIFTVHHTSDLPARGVENYVVIQCLFGESGHLNTWLNGDQVVDADAPIGYYTDLSDGSGRSILGYPQWGLYTKNQPYTDIAYICNIEWGTNSLLSRAASPLDVPDVAW